DLVPREELAGAVALGGISVNVARALGPALGGLLVAALGAGWVFLLNAASFLGVVLVLARWHREVPRSRLPPEDVPGAMRAGVRYVRHSAPFRAVLARTAAFVVPASALWALLPLFARRGLGLSATGYGLLLGCLGAAALVGAASPGAWSRPTRTSPRRWLRARRCCSPAPSPRAASCFTASRTSTCAPTRAGRCPRPHASSTATRAPCSSRSSTMSIPTGPRSSCAPYGGSSRSAAATAPFAGASTATPRTRTGGSRCSSSSPGSSTSASTSASPPTTALCSRPPPASTAAGTDRACATTSRGG